MRVKLGIWHDRVSVFFREAPWEGGVSLSLNRCDGELVRLTVQKGQLRPFRHRADALDTMQFPMRVDDKYCERSGIARCSLMEVVLTSSGASNTLVALLPPDYKFPWPRARDCLQYLRDEELLEECWLRRRIARQMGETPPSPPAYVTQLMSPESRMRYFSGE